MVQMVPHLPCLPVFQTPVSRSPKIKKTNNFLLNQLLNLQILKVSAHIKKISFFLQRFYGVKRIYKQKDGERVSLENKWIKEVQRNGSRVAAEQLIRAYYDEIYAFCFRQTNHKEDAMDLTQEIFLAALRAIPRYDVRKASFRTWLYRIASNKVIDSRRRAHKDIISLEDTDEMPGEDFTPDVQDRLLKEQIESYVSNCDPCVQAVWRLHLYGEKPFPEIARILGEQESAVKARYYRLLNRLRKEFSNA